MKHIETIEKLTAEILSDELYPLALKQKLDDFQTFLIELVQLDTEKKSSRDDLHFDNGIALCTTFAAFCVSDFMRTRQFVRGIFKAVEQLQEQKRTRPINILYAGTGPFATLILPLLARYSPAEIQLTLLEVNEQTLFHLKQLVAQLEIEDYIEKIICEDASKYSIYKDSTIDILISETMQHALVKEQQVPIMLNLVRQLNEETIIIPNKIQLDLALMNTDTRLLIQPSSGQSKYKKLKPLWTFDKAFMKAYQHENKNPNQEERLNLCDGFKFPNDPIYDKLVVLTSIQTHDKEWIAIDASGLTIPKVLLDVKALEAKEIEISLDYVLNNNPAFSYKIT